MGTQINQSPPPPPSTPSAEPATPRTPATQPNNAPLNSQPNLNGAPAPQTQPNLNPGSQTNSSVMNAFVQNSQAQSEIASNLGEQILLDSVDQTSYDQRQVSRESYEARTDSERSHGEATRRSFMMQQDDINASRQKIFQQLMSSQEKSAQYDAKRARMQNLAHDVHVSDRAQAEAENPMLRLSSRAGRGLLREDKGDLQRFQLKGRLPPGYQAFMQNSPRGRSIFLVTPDPLEHLQDGGAEQQQKTGEKNTKQANKTGRSTANLTQGALASQKKLAKQMGFKEGVGDSEELEEFLELEEGEESQEVSDDSDPTMDALKRSMGAKSSRLKGKGDGEEKAEEFMPWQTFGEAIEHHTALFSAGDAAESANLASEANFASAIIYGAAIHIRMKGRRLNYSGTSHHGLPIPSGDEALEMGAQQLVAGFERDMGQLGVESVFVNGQRFELANPEDERKLKELIKDNPDLYRMIEDIREAIRESRFYRTCLGLTEEGPGGRA